MIYERICDRQTIEQSWKKVRQLNTSPGIDRVKCIDFEKHLSFNLDKMHKELLSGTYRPLPVVTFKDRKQSKKERLIGISTVRDRVVQQAILSAVTPCFEKHFLPCVYSYRPKKSAMHAVAKAGQLIKQGNLWCLQLDVKDFFDSIDHGTLLELLGKVIDEKPVVRLVSRLIKARIFKEMGLFDNLKGMHQGSGLSPLLSNIYLHPLDSLLWSTYKDKYLRFSDDITLFLESQEELLKAQGLIEKGLGELKLTVNSAKTQIGHVAGGIVYLGFCMDATGKGPDKKSVEQLQGKLRQFNKVRKTDNIHEKLREITAVIKGWHQYYKTLRPIEPENPLTAIALSMIAEEYGQHQLARQVASKGSGFTFKHPELAYQLGELYEAHGMANQAMRSYARAIDLDPGMEKAKEKIRAYQANESDVYRAIETIRSVLHQHPHFQEGYERLSECYASLGLYGFAQKAHQKALVYDDDLKPAGWSPELENESGCDDFDCKTIDIKLFLELFKGADHIHAKQWVDEKGRWGFARVDRGMKFKDVHKHLKGEETLAVFPVSSTGKVRFVVFDVDTAKRKILKAEPGQLDKFRERAHQDILRIKSVCEKIGMSLHIEDSGYKGRHGWLFFDEALGVSRAVRMAREIMRRAGKPSEDMIWEVFPMGKSERHKSCIKLPLGINRKSNRRCLFLNDANRAIVDQGLFLKTIKKSSTAGIVGHANNKDSGAEDPLPQDLNNMVSGCKVIDHLMAKAKETNYLNHYERNCLLYTLTFAGKNGEDLLHKVISRCINYNPQITQGYIARRKSRPISCARIMENFPELTRDLPCDCKLTPPPRSYPSPVLYLVEAEIAKSEDPAPREIDLAAQQTRTAAGQDETEPPETLPDKDTSISSEAQVPVLDFESIFMSESGNGIAAKHTVSQAVEDQSVHHQASRKTDKRPAAKKMSKRIIVEGASQNVVKRDNGGRNSWKTMQKDALDLLIEYATLKRRFGRIQDQLSMVQGRLDELFNNGRQGIVETRCGKLKRIKKDNGDVWLLAMKA